MDIESPRREAPPESVIPMINVVFLLLIFFLISATLSPPVDATPPVSSAKGERADPAALVLDKEGAIRFGDLTGEAAIAAAAAAFDRSGEAPFALLADAAAPGGALARAMRGLAGRGVRRVALTTLRGDAGGVDPAQAEGPARQCAEGAAGPC